MGYFDGWWGDDYLDTWFDPATGAIVPIVPPSGLGGASNKLSLSTLAPRPKVPLWRQIDGAVGTALTEIRGFLADAVTRPHLWGNHVQVTFTAASTATRVQTGLGTVAKGYKIVKSNANLTVWDATSATPSNDRGVIWLQASAPGTVTLYCY